MFRRRKNASVARPFVRQTSAVTTIPFVIRPVIVRPFRFCRKTVERVRVSVGSRDGRRTVAAVGLVVVRMISRTRRLVPYFYIHAYICIYI